MELREGGRERPKAPGATSAPAPDPSPAGNEAGKTKINPPCGACRGKNTELPPQSWSFQPNPGISTQKSPSFHPNPRVSTKSWSFHSNPGISTQKSQSFHQIPRVSTQILEFPPKSWDFHPKIPEFPAKSWDFHPKLPEFPPKSLTLSSPVLFSCSKS